MSCIDFCSFYCTFIQSELKYRMHFEINIVSLFSQKLNYRIVSCLDILLFFLLYIHMICIQMQCTFQSKWSFFIQPKTECFPSVLHRLFTVHGQSTQNIRIMSCSCGNHWHLFRLISIRTYKLVIPLHIEKLQMKEVLKYSLKQTNH